MRTNIFKASAISPHLTIATEYSRAGATGKLIKKGKK